MKKCIILGLALLVLGTALFADDAKVMPARVGRFYLAPNFSFASGGFDEDGKLQKFDDGSIKIFNLGFALEYGVNDWITAAVQWAPGWTPWSDLEARSGFKDSNVNGVADLFVGAKLQIIGEKAPVQNNMFRIAVAPGVIIPLPGPDFEEQFENAMAGKKATVANMDKHTLGVGGRLYFDWVINDKFFINLFNETIIFPLKKDLNDTGPNLAGFKGGLLGTVNTLAGPTAMAAVKKYTDKLEGEVDYKYQLTFELEPQFSTSIADGLIFSAGLPFNYVYNPAAAYSFTGLKDLVDFASGMGIPLTEEAVIEQGGFAGAESHFLSLRPNVSLFLLKTPLPLEFKFQYGLPLYGKNTQATNTVIFQVKAYFQI